MSVVEPSKLGDSYVRAVSPNRSDWEFKPFGLGVRTVRTVGLNGSKSEAKQKKWQEKAVGGLKIA